MMNINNIHIGCNTSTSTSSTSVTSTNQFKSASLNCNFGLVIGNKKKVHLFDFNYLKVLSFVIFKNFLN